MGEELVDATESLKVGDVRDLSNFTSAVIDQRAFTKHVQAIARAGDSGDAKIIAGGVTDDREGWYVRPTLIISDNPRNDIFVTEYFGPILGIYVFDDSDFEAILDEVDRAAPYALTGAVLADERAALDQASRRLRYAAGNFYLNDKPTGAVVGQQPFGGARASGTDDKAGSKLNLIRWVNTRTMKETLAPPRDYKYPFMGAE
jgi:1-pyrroline-5-carboxylate dehydrogenase